MLLFVLAYLVSQSFLRSISADAVFESRPLPKVRFTGRASITWIALRRRLITGSLLRSRFLQLFVGSAFRGSRLDPCLKMISEALALDLVDSTRRFGSLTWAARFSVENMTREI